MDPIQQALELIGSARGDQTFRAEQMQALAGSGDVLNVAVALSILAYDACDAAVRLGHPAGTPFEMAEQLARSLQPPEQ